MWNERDCVSPGCRFSPSTTWLLRVFFLMGHRYRIRTSPGHPLLFSFCPSLPPSFTHTSPICLQQSFPTHSTGTHPQSTFLLPPSLLPDSPQSWEGAKTWTVPMSWESLVYSPSGPQSTGVLNVQHSWVTAAGRSGHSTGFVASRPLGCDFSLWLRSVFCSVSENLLQNAEP